MCTLVAGRCKHCSRDVGQCNRVCQNCFQGEGIDSYINEKPKDCSQTGNGHWLKVMCETFKVWFQYLVCNNCKLGTGRCGVSQSCRDMHIPNRRFADSWGLCLIWHCWIEKLLVPHGEDSWSVNQWPSSFCSMWLILFFFFGGGVFYYSSVHFFTLFAHLCMQIQALPALQRQLCAK